MAEPLEVRPGVVVPAEAMEMRAVRSGGPGGQNVNKVASKVELRVDLLRIAGLDPTAQARLRAMAARALDADGWLLVTSQRTRDQRMNLDDARGKVRALVLRALERARPRRKTKPTRGSVERRIEEKKRRARVKAGRRDAEK
ncbi:MAG: alternative ribosome rescue aminoacyl-tRNA hydrolase ArfB [Polyangiaceae bacterium]